MSLDTFPVFKPYQALTAEHLNDLRAYLDHEDKLTRRALAGVGILCGFELDRAPDGRLAISKGVAVTSHGYLIAEPAVVCDRVRAYAAPVPTGDDIAPEAAEEARYPFLFPDGETQIAAWELVVTGAAPPAQGPAVTPLTAAFLADKTVMLFLETNERALRNCDINDCSDRGAQREVVLRRLLVRRQDADAMLQAEAGLAGRPVDPASHPSLGLAHLRVEDLGIARNGIATWPALFARILDIAGRFLADLPATLRSGWQAYRYLLADMYPDAPAQTGPFPDGYLGNVWRQLAAKPFLVQYLYAHMLDVAAAWNEFVAAARALEAECLTDPRRFPRHVLLGDPAPRPRGLVAAASGTEGGGGAFAAHVPGNASTGFGPHPRPARRRTPWIAARPGPALADLRALFHRLTLLAHSFDLASLQGAEIRVIPSKHGASALGERCIPAHYAFGTGSDLFRVWSPARTRGNLLATVHGYPFSPRTGAHPYLFRSDGEDFHAVAGHVGRSLDQVIHELAEHKRVLGLDFAIEPVLLGMSIASDAEGRILDAETAGRAREAVRLLIFCRMRDFEVILLGLLAGLFAFLVWLLRALTRQRPRDFAVQPSENLTTPATQPGGAAAAGGGLAAGTANMASAQPGISGIDSAVLFELAGREALRQNAAVMTLTRGLTTEERHEIDMLSATVMTEFRKQPMARGEAMKFVAAGATADDPSLATFYTRVTAAADGNLFDRVRREAQGLEISDTASVGRLYDAVALMDATEALMAETATGSLADFRPEAFEAAMTDFAAKLERYRGTAPTSGAQMSQESAAINLAIAERAPGVAVLSGFFSSAGLMGEVGRRMQAVFEELTLAGHARRHPGVQHRSGVPSGGTLVLAYAAKRELPELARRAGGELARLAVAVGVPGAANLPDALAMGAREIMELAGPPGDHPLSEFVVLADFCLPSKCCDSDCTDALVARRDRAPVFDLSETGPMAVPPVIPNGDAGQGVRPGFGLAGRGDILAAIGVGLGRAPILDARLEELARPMGEQARARLARELEAERARAEEDARATRDDNHSRTEEEERRRREDEARQREEAERQRAEEEAEAERRRDDEARREDERRRLEKEARQREEAEAERRRDEENRETLRPGELSVFVAGTGGAARIPVEGARVMVANAETGEAVGTLRVGADGLLSERLPEGRYTLTSTAEGYVPRPVEVVVSADERSEVAIHMVRLRQ